MVFADIREQVMNQPSNESARRIDSRNQLRNNLKQRPG